MNSWDRVSGIETKRLLLLLVFGIQKESSLVEFCIECLFLTEYAHQTGPCGPVIVSFHMMRMIYEFGF